MKIISKTLVICLSLCMVTNFVAAQANTQQVVFITAVKNGDGNPSITTDFVQMLTGKKAVAAAKRKGDAEFNVEKNGDTTWYVPNDYYIVNDTKKLRTLLLSSDARILLIKKNTSTLFKSNIKELAKSFSEKLFTLTIKNEQVIKISEIYTP